MVRIKVHQQAGFSLVEVLFATILLGVGFMCLMSVFSVAMKATGRVVEDSLEQTVRQSIESEIRTLFWMGYQFPKFSDSTIAGKQAPILAVVDSVDDKNTLTLERKSGPKVTSNMLGNGSNDGELDPANRVLVLLSGPSRGKMYEITGNTAENGAQKFRVSCADSKADTDFLRDLVEQGVQVVISGYDKSKVAFGPALKEWPADPVKDGGGTEHPIYSNQKSVFSGGDVRSVGEYGYIAVVSGPLDAESVIPFVRVDVSVWARSMYDSSKRPEENVRPVHHFFFYVAEPQK